MRWMSLVDLVGGCFLFPFFSYFLFLFLFFLFLFFFHHLLHLFTARSSLRNQMIHILRGAGIDFPVRSYPLKKTSAMKSAYADLRELLRVNEKGQLLKGGTIRLTPSMLDVFL